jgi:hypothetical protein
MPVKMAKGKQHYLDELKQMLKERGSEPEDKVLTVFCQRHGISLEECRKYRKELATAKK